ncbi:LOG family protein [Caldivirga sp. UBA161]|uniref:SLOG cluster 4 domain-containing protein n=1 Tax=Caldivirga sp. UBA161 TaxID=1915569 RepID=UPI0025BA99A3|nr:LOG family protein [Caldivirga sp. UBA161]
MQVAIAAHSGEYRDKHVKAIKDVMDGLTQCKPTILLGGYWGLMKVAADEAISRGLRVVLILPIENDAIEVPKDAVIVRTGMEFRERSVVLIRSSDSVVAIGGAAGTIMEVLLAYAMGKPTIVLKGMGFPTDRLELAFPDYVDDRRTSRILYITNPREAGKLACTLNGAQVKEQG